MTHRHDQFTLCRITRLIAILTAALLGLALAAEDSAQAPASAPVVPAYRQANQLAVITIDGIVDRVTKMSLERRIDQALDEGADAIVLELDTPGGLMDVTLDICAMLKDPSEVPLNTVAWVHPKAYSAGTIIALACREIVVSPNATFGDAAPIYGLPLLGLIEMAEAERAKVEAPLLSEVIDSARLHHYDENLVQAFVSVGIELWLIENVNTGERIFVDRGEYLTVFGEEPPAQMTRVAPPKTAGPPKREVVPWFNTTIPQSEDPGGLTPEQIREQVKFQQQLPPPRSPLTEDDRLDWRLVTQVVSSDRLLTVKQSEALYYGLAVETIANDEQLKAFFGAGSLKRYDATWSEGLVRVLISWPIKILLIVTFIICLFVELAAPGLGVFGATALVALLLLVGAPALAGMAQWWDILLIFAGIVLLAMEIFVIPGLGIAGVGGALCLLVGLVGTFVTGDITSPRGQSELLTGIGSTLAALVAAGIGIWLISRHTGALPALGRLVLNAEVGSSSNADTRGGGLLEAMQPSSRGENVALGDTGVAETDLRPSGRATINGRLVDVQSPGRYIDQGRRIRVSGVGRYVVEVEEAD